MYELREKLSLATVSSGQGLFNKLQTTLLNIIPHQNSKDKPVNASVVYRSEKKKNFTIIDNRILRSPNLSLKAIGLLCKILSLPYDWKYSVPGLAAICQESQTAVKSALAELKEWGYVKITKLTPDQTQSGRIEYVYEFYEYSDKDTLKGNDIDRFNSSGPDIEPRASIEIDQYNMKQAAENQALEIQAAEIQLQGNDTQINTDNKTKNNLLLNDELPTNHFLSSKNAVENNTDRQIDGYTSELEKYTEFVKEKIDYGNFVEWLEDEKEAEEIVQMIVRQICSRKSTECICGQEYPREIVKSAMLKVDISTLEEAVESVSHAKNVHNFEKYLISTLFNAVNTQRFKEDSEAKFVDYAFKRDFGERAV